MADDNSQGRFEAIAVGLLFMVLAVAMVALGSRDWLPELASRHGAGVDKMLVYLLVTTGAMFLVGHFVLGFFVWRYTRGGGVQNRMASPKMERNWSIALGLLMTLVAEGGVLAIGMPTWTEYFASAPPGDALTVEVTPEQFAWNVRYPGADGVFGETDSSLIELNNPIGVDPEDPRGKDDYTAINQIHVPVGRPVRVRLRSKDVIHSFFLPQFRVKQDAVPGMTIEVWFVPTKTGRYELPCTELCGLGHYRMKGFFNVLTAEDFETWKSETFAAEEVG
ncbi:MAG: cytochrome-c oxidase [bacterium]|nr:cytochrome-c oxidase [bacterium]